MGPILSSSPGCLMMGRSASPKAVPRVPSTGWQQSPLVGVAQPKGRFEWTCHFLPSKEKDPLCAFMNGSWG